jgi:hypothetical protein
MRVLELVGLDEQLATIVRTPPPQDGRRPDTR